MAEEGGVAEASVVNAPNQLERKIIRQIEVSRPARSVWKLSRLTLTLRCSNPCSSTSETATSPGTSFCRRKSKKTRDVSCTSCHVCDHVIITGGNPRRGGDERTSHIQPTEGKLRLRRFHPSLVNVEQHLSPYPQTSNSLRPLLENRPMES